MYTPAALMEKVGQAIFNLIVLVLTAVLGVLAVEVALKCFLFICPS